MALSSGHPPESICVIRLSAIGDCCHTLPVLRALQSAWPTTRLTWIIGTTEHALMQGVAGIEFITFDKSRMAPSLWRVRRQLHRQLGRQRFDILLHMHASMRANLVSGVVRADRRIGFDRARARDGQWLLTNERIAPRAGQHAMEALLGFAEHLGITVPEPRWDIPVSDADRRFADGFRNDAGPLVVISPCTSQRFRNYRNWPVVNYIELVRALRERFGASVLLTGGRSAEEAEYGREIGAALGEGVTNLIGRTNLKQLFALIDAADLLIAPDSGPVHMATAAGTTVIGLYATSNPRRTGPWRDRERVVDRYPEAVRREFGVSVDELRFGQRVRDPQAMALIRVEDVLTEVRRLFSAGAY